MRTEQEKECKKQERKDESMRPLEGVKVVDLTTYLAAPTTVRVLGEWGADCVKIESAKGDPARTQGAVFNMPYSDEEIGRASCRERV